MSHKPANFNPSLGIPCYFFRAERRALPRPVLPLPLAVFGLLILLFPDSSSSALTAPSSSLSPPSASSGKSSIVSSSFTDAALLVRLLLSTSCCNFDTRGPLAGVRALRPGRLPGAGADPGSSVSSPVLSRLDGLSSGDLDPAGSSLRAT